MVRAFACIAFLLVTLLSSSAFAEEREAPRVGSVAVPGTGGRVLELAIWAFHRPPPTPPARLMGWNPVPAELPRATVATLWKITF
jgi:hypothetical protein